MKVWNCSQNNNNSLCLDESVFNKEQIKDLRNTIYNIIEQYNLKMKIINIVNINNFYFFTDSLELNSDMDFDLHLFHIHFKQNNDSFFFEITGIFENFFQLSNIMFEGAKKDIRFLDESFNIRATFKNRLYISELTYDNDINIGNQSFTSNETYIKSLDISNLKTRKDLRISNLYVSLILLNKIDCDYLIIEGLNYQIPSFLSNIENKYKIEILEVDVNHIYIRERNFAEVKYSHYLDKEISNVDIFIKDSEIQESMHIVYKENNIFQLLFHNAIFQKDSKLFLKNMNIETFIIDDITQDWSEAIFENITVTEKLILKNVNFKNTTFINCDFSGCKIEISNSVSFKDTLFNSVNWGDISRIKADRDIFRQIKKEYRKAENTILTQQFCLAEANQHKKGNKYDYINLYMECKPMLKNIGLIGSIASIIGFLLYFIPSSKTVNNNGVTISGDNLNNSGTISINNNIDTNHSK